MRKLLGRVTWSWIGNRVPCWPLHDWNTWQVRCYDSGTGESFAVGHAACTVSSELTHQSVNKQQNFQALFKSPQTPYTTRQHDDYL